MILLSIDTSYTLTDAAAAAGATEPRAAATTPAMKKNTVQMTQ